MALQTKTVNSTIKSYRLEAVMSNLLAEEIRDLAEEIGAFLVGSYTLASGKNSDHYFDGKTLMSYPEVAYKVGKYIYDRIVCLKPDYIGGLVLGAVPIASVVSLVSYQERKPIRTFLVREENKEHGTKRIVEGGLKANCKVVIVDDVVTRGGSIKKAIDAAEAIGCTVVKVFTIVDRDEGGSQMLRDKGYDFESILTLKPSGDIEVSDEHYDTEGQTRKRVIC